MLHRKMAIVSVVLLSAFTVVMFVPTIPIVMHERDIVTVGNPRAQCFISLENSSVVPCPTSYSYYGSVSYYISGIGMTYLPNSAFPPTSPGYHWSPYFPRS